MNKRTGLLCRLGLHHSGKSLSFDELEESDLHKFWNRTVVHADSCWLFSSTWDDGYGTIYLANKRRQGSHRVSYAIHYGLVPDGLFVCHKCDNPQCVRPDHLFLGTNQDNGMDATVKGRRKGVNRGSANAMSILRESDISEIHRLFRSGSSRREIAKLFKTSHRHISTILIGRLWGHVCSPIPKRHVSPRSITPRECDREIGASMRSLRIRAGQTIIGLRRKTGISRDTLKLLEEGKTFWTQQRFHAVWTAIA